MSESYIAQFEQASRKLLFAIGDPDLGDHAFRVKLAEFTVEADRLRAFWKGFGWDYMANMLKLFNDAEKAAP